MVSDTIRRGSEIVARPRVEWCQTPFDLVSEAMLEEPTSDGELVDPRRSDVDEWGRSERMREVARAVYGPLYRTWHRVEWEGCDKLPREGGALLVSNHSRALPSDAPSIMHGIAPALGRPASGRADKTFKRRPVVGITEERRVGK